MKALFDGKCGLKEFFFVGKLGLPTPLKTALAMPLQLRVGFKKFLVVCYIPVEVFL